MAFLNPSAFYLSILLPLVALLHFLKLRRQRHVVPSVMLWLGAIEDMKANVPFQRLRSWLLLALQLLLMLALMCSLARPAFLRPGEIAARSIVIIDTSASMAAIHSGTKRINAAKDKALALIDRLGAETQMMLMDTRPPSGHILQAFTSDKTALRAAVANLSVAHTSSNFPAVFSAVRAYADAPGTQVFLISDAPVDLPPFPVHTIFVGEPEDNVAIVGLEVASSNDLYRVFAEVQSFSETESQFKAILEINGIWYYDETVVLPPKGRQSLLFSIDDKEVAGQPISVRLDVDDALPADNTAWAILEQPAALEVLLVSDRGQPLLNSLLKAAASIRLRQIPTQAYHGRGNSDIVIFDRFVPAVIPDGGVVFLNPIDGLPFMPVREVISQNARVINQNASHEVMQQVAFIDLEVKGMLKGELPVWGLPLLETAHGALVWLGEQPGRRLVVFAFDPFQPAVSNFAFFEKSIASPLIFMAQCLAWLDAVNAPIAPTLLKTGQPVTLRAEGAVAVALPDGTRRSVEGASVFTETTQAGVYTVFANDQQIGTFAANLLDPVESDLRTTPSAESESPPAQAHTAQTATQNVHEELWHYAAALALLLLIVEWWVYHRGN